MAMAKRTVDTRSLKEFAIDVLETAYVNLLQTLWGIKPDVVEAQIDPEINPIIWIVGHCAAHMDGQFLLQAQGKSVMGECGWQKGSPFLTGSTKEDIAKGCPISFKEIVDGLLEIGDETFAYLQELPEEVFRYLPAEITTRSKESVLTNVQRMALHFMGHMGQIRIIRRVLNNKARGYFVTGIEPTYRKQVKQRFIAWWNANKSEFA
jgi:hypothetical protein